MVKGLKVDVADGEGLAGLKVLDRRKPGGIVLERGRTAASRFWAGRAVCRRGRFGDLGLAVGLRLLGVGLLGRVFHSRRFGLGLALGGLFAAQLEPLGVGHLAARREPAHPGAMRGLSKVNRNAEFARRDGEAVDVVLVLVGDDDGVEGCGVFAGQLHAPEKLAAAQAASTRMRVRPPEITVLLPFDPEASTVKRTMV